ncbi:MULTISPECIES: LysR family transcriptional regulator [Cobetia]|uniref:LysR family transcriptional regulator n=1 Tax=Cobetia TaxID=204286 RepID=UPI001582ED4C|nr:MULTISPECIES: LysR family transcriptional regulator [Cobetia]MDI4661994.1 LysR family transcriptional regulator [Cobetia sp. BMC6]NUJ57459.1 LysR family transcriptional regulator [Cobetia marina]NVN56225.1 LysR family transcriptional regulator [bacterium Scap17]
MDRLQTLEVFVAVADAGGFAAGSRALGMSAPSVTRGINALEARLGTRLFTRSTRRVRLTEIGQRYLEDARRILAELQAAEDSVSGAATRPTGVLRITCPTEFGRLHVMPLLMEYLERYPEMRAEVVMVDRVVNMIEEGFDIAVRIGSLPSSGLSALRVGSVRRVVCGSPAHFAREGIPNSLEALAAQRIIASSNLGAGKEWRFGREGEYAIRISPRLTMSSIAACIEAARSGWGITRVLSYQVGEDLVAGRLQAVLEELEPPALPIHLLHSEGRGAVAKVRTFLDFAAERLRANPVLNPSPSARLTD